MDKLQAVLHTFWVEWEPHLAFFSAFAVLAWMHTNAAHPFDPIVEAIVLIVAGGPQARDMAVSVIKEWKGSKQ